MYVPVTCQEKISSPLIFLSLSPSFPSFSFSHCLPRSKGYPHFHSQSFIRSICLKRDSLIESDTSAKSSTMYQATNVYFICLFATIGKICLKLSRDRLFMLFMLCRRLSLRFRYRVDVRCPGYASIQTTFW